MRRAALSGSRVCRVPGAHRPAPSLFHYLGLSASPFHRRESFEWVQELEKATPRITEEFRAVRHRPSDYDIEGTDHAAALHTGGEWHWASLIDRGRVQSGLWEKCRETSAVLEGIPNLCLGEMPFAFAFFSTLKAGCKIAPHTAPCNLRLRVHLPLIVPEPEACGIRVAGETRRWEVGKAMIFDDSFEHETWNDGSSERVVLLFDLWHPDLTETEIVSIREMFAEVERMQDARKAS